MSTPNLARTLHEVALELPDRIGYTFLDEQGEVAGRWTFSELDRRADAVAAALTPVTAAGDRALLLFPSGLDFLAGFYGALRAGVIAVPASPPNPERLERTLPRLLALVEAARPSVVLTVGALARAARRFADLAPALLRVPWIAVDTVPDASVSPRGSPDGLAFLQYTSGSTSTPKGVRVSHANLAEQMRTFSLHDGFGRHTVFGSWLPIHHDMGLIGKLLTPAWYGAHTIFMAPSTFLRRPALWPRMMSDFRAEVSAAPDFAYALCAARTRPEEKVGLDLSGWTRAMNGAEPIRARTLDAFARAFAECGFRPEALSPCYGLAEATLQVTGVPVGQAHQRLRLDPAALRAGRARVVSEGGVEHVSSGSALPDLTVDIVGPEGALPDGEVGEIRVRGPTVAEGYWGQEDAFLGGLRTGDLGFLHEGELYVVGRVKDLLILGGANHYPQDIERCVEGCHPAVRLGQVAAFAMETDDGEAVGLAVEVTGDDAELCPAIRRAVAKGTDLAVHTIGLLPPGALPKTTSGKIQRFRCAEGLRTRSLPFLRIDGPPTPPVAAAPSGNVLDWLLGRVAALGGVPAADESFAAQGIDSRKGLELLSQLEARLGRTVPTELLYRHPTPARLAQALEAGGSEARASDARASDARGAPANAAVGVLGMAARLPGAAGLDELWEMLRAGRCAVGPAPAGRSGTGDAGWLADIDGFDHAAFKISAAEAAEMDPHQRLLLEVTWEALADAGLAPGALEGREVGVYVGLSGAHPALPASPSPWTATGGSAAIAANRISYLLDLRGPSMAVDTACSSGLSALHLAVAAIRSGEIELAVVASANLLLDEALTDALAAAGFLAPRCRVFDADAKGYVRGEGVVAVVLGADGPGVRARILGSAQGQDGRSNGLTAPNPAAQEVVIRRSWANAGRSPGDAAAFELHGTGTVIGDPIEAQALARVVPGGRYLLGAVKASLGHLEAAAGLAGLAKVVLAMEHAWWPPQPLLDTPNPRIPWDRFRVSAGEAWTPGPVGLSAFSFGGSNVHVVVAPPSAPRRAPLPAPRWSRAGSTVLPVSAHTPEEHIAAVLRGVLGSVGLAEPDANTLLTTPLVELGLDSMLAMGLAARLERDLGLVVPVEQLLGGVTGRELIARITGGTVEPPAPFPRRLVDAVGARPEVVVTDEEGSLTGAALAAAIRDLAARLAEAGVVPGDRVGVVLPRGRHAVVAIGAIAWLGAAWVPADPAWPRARRDEVLQDAGAGVVVGEGGLPALVPEPFAAEAPPLAARPDGLAYILYTSGSTGRPKGVAVSHRALSTNLEALDRALGLRAPRWLSVTSLAFDISIAELLLPLLSGGTLHLVSDATARDGLRLRARVEVVDPDWLQATPGTWRMLLNAGWVGSPRLSAISGGETLPRPLADALRERCAALWNAYGPTEATIWATLARVDGDVTIGRPLPGYHVRQQGEELWIGGPALAEGYWRDPERTAAAFVTHGGARWYRTGDAVELRPDGQWSYRGRLDQQIKVHGARVEPGEVEAALVSLPGVREAVVRPHRGMLVAFVTGALPDDAGVRLAERLPTHMVPTRFVQLENFPRLVSGKVDRSALVPPDEAPVAVATDAEPAEVALLAGLWAEVLEAPAAGDTDFFAAGGDSILATVLMLRVRAVLGREVPFHALTEAPTPRALSEWLARPDATQVELEADVHLDASILPGPRAETSTGEVFFTGATGFLGRVILRRLLEATPWTLHCLVRADSPEEGLHRLGAPHPRLRAVCGDLTKPGLGMDARDRARIADVTDTVVHNGALVNFVFPYRAMRAANVLGTAEVIALAAEGRSKHLHHVSTVAVFESEGYADADEVGEDADLERSTGLWDGYPQSKWVSERLVWEAAARGLPVSVHRPGMVTGTSAPRDDDPHALNPDDFIFRMIRGCALLGVAPELDTLVELVPVDYVADAFVALAAGAGPGVWHLTNPHPLHCHDFIAALGRLGYPMRQLPWTAWREEVLRRLEPQNPLFPLIPFFATRRDPRSMRLPLFGTERTCAALGDRIAPCPPVGDELLGRYLRWMERRGLLRSAGAGSVAPDARGLS